jgi:hypothetical protein
MGKEFRSIIEDLERTDPDSEVRECARILSEKEYRKT